MSIDEVMKIAAVFGPDSLRAAIEQHVAEAVAMEREAVLSLADSEATTLITVAEHLRSQQEFTRSELHMAKAQALVEFRAAIRARGTT